MTKDSFLIDYGDSDIPEKLFKQFSRYNLDHKTKIQRLYVFTSKGLQEVPLEK